MNSISIPTIGIIATPHTSVVNMPIQPIGAKKMVGIAELRPEFAEGLTDIEGFSHVTLVYYFHQIKDYSLMVTPFMDNKEHGIFATRSPKRPSKIGISTVKLLRVVDNKLYFEGADMLNNTPLLDIKPFFRQTDNHPDARSGWLDEKNEELASKMRSDARFV